MPRLEKYKTTTGAFLIRDLMRRIEKQKTYLAQGREQFVHFQLSHLYVKLGLTQYGLGRDYAEVVASLRMATASFLTVFRLKGTTILSSEKHSKNLENLGLATSSRDFAPDFGYTNSKESLFGIAIASLSNQPDDARRIASLAGSPPHVSLPNDRILESAFKAYFSNDMREVEKHLGCIQVDEDPWYEHMRDGFLALLSRSTAQYADAVEGMLALHSREAATDLHKHDPLYNLCYHMMALAVLAVREQVFSMEDIPDRPPYFPREFIEYVPKQ